MSDSTSIPALWSPDEVTAADDGFLFINDETKNYTDDDGLPLMFASTSSLLQALYPSLDMKQILARASCYKFEDIPTEDQESEPEDGVVTDGTWVSSTPDDPKDDISHEGGRTFTGSVSDSHSDKNEVNQIQSKVANEYQIYQDLTRCDNLGNRINSALLDIQYCRHRGAGARRTSYRSRETMKVKALEHEQKRLLQKRSLSNGENARTTNEEETSTNLKDREPVDFQSDRNRAGDTASDDGNDDHCSEDNNFVNQEPRMVLLVRTLNSIRALFPHLLPILNHKRRNDKMLTIRNAGYKTRKKGSMCWLLGTNVFDATTSQLCRASHDDAKRILEGYLDHALAQQISTDPTGSPTFWYNSWVQQVLKRSNPSMPHPRAIVSAESGRSKVEILCRAQQCDRQIYHIGQHENPMIKQQYKKSVNKLRQRLSGILRTRFKGARVSIYGSCLSDLSLGKGSDVDLSLHIPEVQKLKDDFQNGNINARAYEQAMKNNVFRAYHRLSGFKSEFRSLNPVTRARIPVISGTYTFADNPFSNDGSIDFDICFLNDIAVANSGLIREYSLVDPRVRSLMMAVKLWAKDSRINSAKENHLSSYAWMNLVVFYLQCIGFLPNLQSRLLMEATGLRPDPSNQYWHFVNDLDTCTLEWEAVKKAQVWALPQDLTEEPVSVLLYGFFEFYAKRFPISTFAVSIKRGSISLPKLAARKVKHFYSIEDPFETYDSHCPHDLGVPVSENGAKKIIDCIKAAEGHLRLVLCGEKSDDTGLWPNSRKIIPEPEPISGFGRVEDRTNQQATDAGREANVPLPTRAISVESRTRSNKSASRKHHTNQTSRDDVAQVQNATQTNVRIGGTPHMNTLGVENSRQVAGSHTTNLQGAEINQNDSFNRIDRRNATVSNGVDSRRTNRMAGRGGRPGRGRGGRGAKGRFQRDRDSQSDSAGEPRDRNAPNHKMLATGD